LSRLIELRGALVDKRHELGQLVRPDAADHGETVALLRKAANPRFATALILSLDQGVDVFSAPLLVEL